MTPSEARSLAARPAGERWLRLTEGFARQLFATPEGDPGAALAHLLDVLGARGCSLIEWSDEGRPVVLATRGSACLDPPRSELSFSSDEERTIACLREPGRPPLGLVVLGDFAARADCASLLRVLLRLFDPLRRAPAGEEVPAGRGEGDSGLVFPAGYLPMTSPPMVDLYRQMRALNKGDMPVLILGETGVGKERLASILHHSSASSGGPLVAINCAAIPTDLLEAELFGIGKGVATGVANRLGKFQLAAGGTLFLDEIGEMQPHLQSKLLRALEEKQIQPVGGRPVSIETRIVAATNADLGRRIEEGEFRLDLYYRLAGFTLEVPPLRDCRDDLPTLVQHFLRCFARQEELDYRGITAGALRLLTDYRWPGNVRELQNEIRRLVYLCADQEKVIDAAMISAHITSARLARIAVPEVATSKTLLLNPALRRLEGRFLREALRRTGGRQIHAARLLGISRNGLADKLKRLGIDPRADFASTDPGA